MAKPNLALISILRETANRLEAGDRYTWGHMGRCNCGHVAQTITRLEPAELHRRGQRADVGRGEWTEHANDYCGLTGAPLDNVLDQMLEVGFEISDINHLEYLSDRRVLEKLPGGFRHLARNRRDNVVAYLRAWADLMAEYVSAKPQPLSTAQPRERQMAMI